MISEEAGMKLDNAKITDLGSAKRVVIDRDDTTLVGGAGNKGSIEGRINQDQKQIQMASGEYDREKLRNASLSSPEAWP